MLTFIMVIIILSQELFVKMIDRVTSEDLEIVQVSFPSSRALLEGFWQHLSVNLSIGQFIQHWLSKRYLVKIQRLPNLQYRNFAKY